MPDSYPESLLRHAERLRKISLRTLFAEDRERSFLCRDIEGIHIDASRQRLDAAAWADLLRMGDQVEPARSDLFAGMPVNATENRPALHPALRDPRPEGLVVEGVDILAEVHRQHQRMREFADACATRWQTVVNLGIGGSDLGPRMLCETFPQAPGAPDVHFASTLDPEELNAVLHGCDASQTFFIVASKTFTTEETQRNFSAAKQWLAEQGVESGEVMEHFAATTAAADRAQECGIGAQRIFPFWEGVGGRYSVWSTVGLPVVLHAGWDAFEQLLAGAHAVDEHFREAEAESNVPLLLALLMFWNHTFLGAATRVVLPYNYRLRTLPRFLQQLQMESLGKRADTHGELQEVAAPVVWGGSANDGAHAFFQLLHQGSQVVPVDAVVARGDLGNERERALLAQCLSQLDLLASGRTFEEVGPAAGVAPGHYVHPGDRPSTLFLMEDLSPRRVGALLALFEHVTFSVAAFWGINAFDQFGVEYGKRLSRSLAEALQEESVPAPGHTLDALLDRLRYR